MWACMGTGLGLWANLGTSGCTAVGAAVLSTPLIDIDGCVTVADFAGGLWHFGPQLLGANSHVAGKL